MLSRVADSIFWLGRYTERADNYARFIDVNFNLSLDLPQGMEEQWKPLISVTGDQDYFESLFGSDYSRKNAVFFLAFDERNLNSIINTVRKSRENARIIRENIPKETWETINSLHYYVQDALHSKLWKKEDLKPFFTEIKNKIQLLNGIAHENIPRNEGWFFTKLGQYLERADKTSRILDVKYHYLLPSADEVGTPLDFLHWNALLKSVSGFNAYRKIYGKISSVSIAEYLVLNRHFPRSILFCLTEAENCLHEISNSKRGFTNLAEKSIGNLRSDMEYADIQDVFDFGLHEYLDRFQLQLAEIFEQVNEEYFKIQTNFDSGFQNQE